MASLTIHDIETELNERLSAAARRSGKSKNAYIKEVLAREMGVPVNGAYADDYSEFVGVWTAAEAREFADTQAGNSAVDPGDWG